MPSIVPSRNPTVFIPSLLESKFLDWSGRIKIGLKNKTLAEVRAFFKFSENLKRENEARVIPPAEIIDSNLPTMCHGNWEH